MHTHTIATITNVGLGCRDFRSGSLGWFIID
jgi:hypothetical protein